MRYKKFKNAEIEVSQLAVGTWAIGGQNYGKVDKNEAICAIRRMIEKGVNLIDTAPCYGNGTSERNSKGTGVNFHKVWLDSGYLYTWI